jgi:hypothetical protein
MEQPGIRRRNTLKNHFTMTSNVILFGYAQLSDSEKLTYQAIDSFDWSDQDGKRKGYAYPSLTTLARLRGVDERTLRRHLAGLEGAGLLRREERAGKPSLLWIEEPSVEESERYLSTIAIGPDRVVRPTPDKNVRPFPESEEKKQTKPLTAAKAFEGRRGGKRFLSAEERAKRDYIANEILRVTKDPHSFGYYRKVAAMRHAHHVFDALGSLKQASEHGRVRNKGALFTYLVTADVTRREDPVT